MLLNSLVYTDYHTPGKFEPIYFCRSGLAVAVGVEPRTQLPGSCVEIMAVGVQV